MLIWKSKCNYERKIASEAKANPKRFFTYKRTNKKAKSNVSPLTGENGVLMQDSKQMARILNIAMVPTVLTSPTLARGIEPVDNTRTRSAKVP